MIECCCAQSLRGVGWLLLSVGYLLTHTIHGTDISVCVG